MRLQALLVCKQGGKHGIEQIASACRKTERGEDFVPEQQAFRQYAVFETNPALAEAYQKGAEGVFLYLSGLLPAETHGLLDIVPQLPSLVPRLEGDTSETR